MTVSVSVIMSAYNAERYIEIAVESILNQTLKDFELLIMDDGSTDSTWKILQNYKLEKRVALFRNKLNIGAASARNELITVSRGKYLAIQDADDVSLPNRLECQLNFAEAHPEVSVLLCGYERIGDAGQSKGVVCYHADHERLAAELLLDCCIRHPCLFISKKAMDQSGGYDANLNRYGAEDYDLYARLIKKGIRFTSLKKILVQIREWPNSNWCGNRYQKKVMLETAFKISRGMLQQHLRCPLDEEAYRCFWWSFLNMAYTDQNSKLKPQDIKTLNPLWELMLLSKTIREVWYRRLFQFSLQQIKRCCLAGVFLLIKILCLGFLGTKSISIRDHN